MSARPLTHLMGALTTREWCSMRRLADAGLFPTADAARKFCTRHRGDLVLGRKGTRLLVDRRSLDGFLERQALTDAASVRPRRAG